MMLLRRGWMLSVSAECHPAIASVSRVSGKPKRETRNTTRLHVVERLQSLTGRM